MKKITFFIIVLFVSYLHEANAQTNWKWTLVREGINCQNTVSTSRPEHEWVFYSTSHSSPGGEKINSVGNYTIIPSPAYMLQFCFENSNTGYAYHSNQAGDQIWFKKTIDGGMSWTAISGPLNNIIYYPMELRKINNLYYLAGINPPGQDFKGLIKSFDLNQWHPEEVGGDITGIAASERGIYVSSWYLDSARLMFQPRSGGQWQRIGLLEFEHETGRPRRNIYSVYFDSTDYKIFMGIGEYVFIYTENSNHLNAIYFPNEIKIDFIRVKNPGAIYVIQYSETDCKVLLTKNGVQSYEIGYFDSKCTNFEILGEGLLISVAGKEGLSDVYFGIDKTLGVGQQNIIPKDFVLSQNYPNPFNPTTTISYSIAKKSQVTLEIYNTVGKEIAVLVNNEVKGPGSYEVTFDASSLSSGIYFYKITAGDFIDMKKMILIK